MCSYVDADVKLIVDPLGMPSGNKSTHARLTWLPSTGEAAAQKLQLLFAAHDCDDDDDNDDDDDDDDR